jgi:hypothetical protein
MRKQHDRHGLRLRPTRRELQLRGRAGLQRVLLDGRDLSAGCERGVLVRSGGRGVSGDRRTGLRRILPAVAALRADDRRSRRDVCLHVV